MSPRVLRVHTLIDSLTWGGAEMLLADLAAAASSAGIEMSVGYLHDVNGSPALPRLHERGVQPQLLNVERMADARALRRVRAHLRVLAPDIVHTHLSIADALGGLAARSLGIPAVSTIHVIGRPVSEPPGPRTAFRAGVIALARRVGDSRVIAVSDAAREAYLTRFHERRERVVTIHNGIVAPTIELGRAETRAALGIAPDALVVAIVAVLRPGKGHDIAAQAVERLQEDFPSLVLLIVGDGPARAEIEALASPLGEKAIFTGHRTNVAELLGAVDVLLHPPSMDAFPTVLLEACAAGLPVLATRVGGIPEIIAHERNGLLLDFPATAQAVSAELAGMLNNPRLRDRMGIAARVRFEEEFSAERWAGRLRKLYDEIA